MGRRDHDTDGQAVQALGAQNGEESDTEHDGGQLRTADRQSGTCRDAMHSQCSEAGGTIAKGDTLRLGVLVRRLADSFKESGAVLGLGHL